MQTIRTHLVGKSVRPGRKPSLVFAGGLDRQMAFFWGEVFRHKLVKKATLKVELETIFAGDFPLKVEKLSECLEIWLFSPEEYNAPEHE